MYHLENRFLLLNFNIEAVPCLQIQVSGKTDMTLMVRIPWWMAGKAQISVNGKEVYCSDQSSIFVPLERTWEDGDVVRIVLPKTVKAEPLPDREDTVAFLDGPVVLAGICEEERMLHVPDVRHPETVLTHDNEREWGSWKSTFRTLGQERSIRFVPLHEVGYDRYSVYFPIKEER